MATVEIIAIGNEILSGDVLDSNTNWLCKTVTGVGGTVRRATIVPDDRAVIAAEVRAALGRRADVIFTTGGLGPTADDMTLESVAEATRQPLQLHPEAHAFVQRTFVELASKGYVDDAALTPARQKMAILPAGARPLDNPVGAAPGVVLRANGATIICLPGVPDELRGIFAGSLQPTLRELFGDSVYHETVAVVRCGDESVLAPILSAAADRNPGVYIKSRARAYGKDVRFRVTLSMSGPSMPAVQERLRSALDDLREALGRAQIAIDSVDENG